MNANTNAMIAVIAASILAGCSEKEAGNAPRAGTSPSTKSEAGAPVFCGGINACNGKSECKTSKHACAGKNECKGQGVLRMSEADCKAKGGTVEPKMM